ncbi:MAG: phage portal protein, partial [Candidatus Peribacteraceae bacterium]|nr:phage portal protein [Candidatus Peribacteraceae bacterium]
MANKTTFGDKVRNFVDKLNPRYADVITSTPVELNKYAYMTTWYYSPKLGQPRFGTPLPTMRKFAQTPQVAMCIKTIIDEITGIEWDIVPRDEYKDTYNKEKAEEVKQFFMYPNRNGETTDDITKMLAKDIFEIDAGVLVKTFDTESYGKPKKYTYNQKQYNENCEYTEDKKIQHTTKKLLPKIEEEEEEINGKTVKTITRNGKLLEIFARDGGSFLQAPDYYGILPDDKPAYFQYSFLATGARPLAFFKREIVYFKMNPRSNNPYGWSPIESLFMILESLNNAVRFNKMFFEENAIPSGALSLIGANKDAFKRFKAMWNKKLKGKPHKLALFNEDMKFTRFVMKNRDMEWLEGQKFYQRLVWAMYGVTSDELGFTETSNRSVGQSQSRVFVRRAIRPLLQLLEQKFTNEVISEF